MKKMLVLIAALTVCGAAMAQISTGDRIVKGTVGLNTLGALSGEGAYNFVHVTPRFEYFTGEHRSVGFSAGMLQTWSKNKYDSVTNRDGYQAFFVGPTLNYYIPLCNRFYLSFNGFLGYVGLSGWTINKGPYASRDSGWTHFGMLSVTPMLNYFINDRWIITLSAGNATLALGGGEYLDGTYYAGINWGTPTLGIGLKF